MKKAKPHSRVVFKDLYKERSDVGDEYIVGDKATSTYVNVPEVAVAAIDLLSQDRSIEETECALGARYQSDVDVLEFVEECISLGFVKELDGESLINKAGDARRTNHLPWLTQRNASFFFARRSWILYAVFFIYSIAMFSFFPHAIPRLEDFLFHTSLTVVVLCGLFTMWGIIFVHELGHLIAARANGSPGWIQFGHQQIYTTVETVLPDLWSLKRPQRIEVYLGGLAFNTVLLSLSLTGVVLVEMGLIAVSDFMLQYIRLIVLINVWCFVTQLMVFSKTDLYYVLNDALGCIDLNGDAYLRMKEIFGLSLVAEERNRLASLTHRERSRASLYVPVYLFGLLFGAAVVLGYAVFVGWYIIKAFSSIGLYPISSLPFWDRLTASAFLLSPYFLIGFYAIRERHKRRSNIEAGVGKDPAAAKDNKSVMS